jgi:cation transport protein ChaC
MSRGARDLWIFAYGSLMWNPGFPFSVRQRAKLVGFRRALCVYSVLYRGTRNRPGLVLGLDRGGACEGIAYRIAADEAPAVLSYVRSRELIYGVYREAVVPVTLAESGSREVLALTYIAERQHPSYAGDLGLAKETRVVRAASGTMGPNMDYLFNTLDHLRALAIDEPRLERLAVMVGAVLSHEQEMLGRRARTASLPSTLRHRLIPARAQRADEKNRFGYRRVIYARACAS